MLSLPLLSTEILFNCSRFDTFLCALLLGHELSEIWGLVHYEQKLPDITEVFFFESPSMAEK